MNAMTNMVKLVWTKMLLGSVFIIYIIAAFLIISGFYLLFTKQKSLGDTVLILGGALASISVVYLAEQIRITIEQEKIKRSYEYFARYNSEAFKETITEACAFIRDGGKTKDKKMDILTNRKNPDYRKIRPIRSFFKSISLSIYNDGNDCIDKLRRESSSQTLFKEWEKMNEDFRDKKIRGEK